MARFLAALSCAVALVGCAGGSGGDAPAWSHDPNDGELGPGTWASLDESFRECGTGRRQSPVDIFRTAPADLPELVFDYGATPLVVENTGHVVEVPMPDESGNTLRIGDEAYRLLQYHFHAPSEHTLGGESFGAEAHLVHESEQGELAVVAIFVDPRVPATPLIDEVFENAPEEAGAEVELEDDANPVELLALADTTNGDVSSYYTYSGSLTTPGCGQGVRWIVLSGVVVGVSDAALDRLHEVIAEFPKYEGYENNNRPVQPLNGRVVRRSGD